MDERISIPVSLPHPNPTVSYWQNPPDEIGDICSTTQLPEEVDIAIVGSGISGAAIAYNVLCRAPGTNIVMLEARNAVSGATGRNGGHTKGASYTTFPTNVEKLGLDEAIKIAKLELNTVRQVHAFARKHNIACESEHIDTTDVIYNQESLEQAAAAVKFMQNVMPNHPASKYTFWNKKETEEKFLVPGAAGAVTYEAGSLSSYKFVIGLLKLCLNQGLNLQTNTPVTSLHKQESSASSSFNYGNSKGWTVVTPRGNIQAAQVIMATNGYSAAIYPKLQGVIVPVRGQVTAHRPGSAIPTSGLSTTYSFNYGSGFDYMIQCPDTSKYPRDIVIGGGFGESKNGGLANYGTTDDSVLDPAIKLGT
ncbi:FAD dependent oxidoreductase [Histoplasma capsulatum H143]|uniref:FAD dependent oxidoreductase n=1 Tax=Ajellomyces capsulatus (strain H143) TaxID=544712 RepID=C6HFW8_AJECH|nr:FAD dependent oxidoreductase [Histoplasma capsulatum H143]